MSKVEMKLTGFGGQGIILMGMLIGRAAALYEDKHAVLIQSFGPEARGGACQAQVIVDDDAVLYPYVTKPNILIALSQEAYTTYLPDLNEGGTLIYEENLVRPDKIPDTINSYCVPSTAIAEELGKRIVQNIVTLGFFTAVTKITSKESMLKAIEAAVPKGTVELNLKAFEKGYNYFSK